MEEELHKLAVWASHGTLRQFYAEISGKANTLGYKTELEGNTLRVFTSHKEGGFLGIGAKEIKEPVFEVTKDGIDIQVNDDVADEGFVHAIVPLLTAH